MQNISSLRQCRGILFDMDGTLFDSGKGIATATCYAMKAMGRPRPGEDILHAIVGPPLRETFPKYFGLTYEETEEAVTSVEPLMPNHAAKRITGYYNLQGMPLNAIPLSGVFIEVGVNKEGTIVTRKVVR